jgi:hypothetical protein
MRNDHPYQEERHVKKGSRRNKALAFQAIINEAFTLEKKYKPEKI